MTMRPPIGRRRPSTGFWGVAGVRHAANDNRPADRGQRHGLRAIVLWHIGVFVIGGGLWFAAALITRLASYVTGIRG
jgi:hypothetical protein